MNGDNPSPNRPLVTVVYKGPDFYDGEKTASKPAVNACMDRFVFCFTLTGIFLH